MNLANLRRICAAYHGKRIEDLTDDNSGADMFLIAVNNARKKAEREHSFESAQMLATLVIEHTTGGALSDATILPASTFSSIKEIKSVAGEVNGCMSPLTLRRPNQGVGLNVPRYPTDGESECGCSYLIIRGDVIYFFPDDGTADDLTIKIEGIGWLDDYVDADLEDTAAIPDFMVEHGFEFLQWATIIELNYKFQTFVFRQEGNPGAPEKLKQAAWESLLTWDSYRVSHHITDDR